MEKNKRINYFDSKHLAQRILMAIIVGTLFSFMGWAIPEVYFKFLDDTQYLTITQPISIDKKEYAPCEKTTLTTKMRAKVNVTVRSLTQLVLTNDKGDKFIVGDIFNAEAPIRAQEEHSISGKLPLPCDLEDGLYFWEGNATYYVRGYEKNLSFISDTFIVKNPIPRQPVAPTRQSTPVPIQSSEPAFQTQTNTIFNEQKTPTPVPTRRILVSPTTAIEGVLNTINNLIP